MTQWEEFAQWWTATESGLIRAARKYGVTREGAKDVVQDVAVLAIRNYARFNSFIEFRRWAYARLHWLLLDEIRASRRKPHESATASIEHSIPPAQEQELIILDIWRLIDQLPTQQRAALVGLIEGYSPLTIAQRLNVKEATVRSLQRHAKKKLVTLLTEREMTT